ncbi:MAG: Do family serine endopeptidase [Proteobacteria bacterium]|nr:Do family serine endopeptidase [Pseudomonadota bacterium]
MRNIAALMGFLISLLAATIAAPAPGKGAATVPATQAQVQLSFAPLVKQAAPAVVNIYTQRVVEQVARSPLFDDPFFRRFFGERFGAGSGRPQRREENSLGSGVLLTADGMIVTNHHVIAGADEITVALSDRRVFEATLVLDDERTDLAVLKIDAGAEKLPYLELRDSDSLEVGDLVLAIGNPFNVGQTVTSGIVSALARTGIGVSDFQFFIQTDAAINPGNSGGALITMDGRLAGVNTAIYSKSGASHGIGFAVPSAMVRAVLDSAKAGRRQVKRPWLGAATQAVTADIAASLGMKRPRGVMVSALYGDGPADRAGMTVGDVILAIDGHAVASPKALNFRLGTRMIGKAARLDVWRNDDTKSLILQLVAAPETPPRDSSELQGRQPLAGATVANLSPALAEELGLDTLGSGVVILKLDPRSPARRFRFREGDQILQVNEHRIGLVADLVAVMKKPVEEWQITMQRADRVHTFRIGK